MNSDKIININEWLQIVRQQVESLSYGSVEITIHDSRIVELDTTEKVRFQPINRAAANQQNAKRLRFGAAVPPSKRPGGRHDSEEGNQNR